MRWLVTGGAGFIGSHFTRTAVQEGWADEVIVLDSLTYAGNLANLEPLSRHSGWRLLEGDITKTEDVARALSGKVDAIFHFAAESHVDRSIMGATEFVRTNVLGTQVLLDAARSSGVKRFMHVSTDEVYGSLALGSAERFTETTPLAPSSPYSASKAASDHLVMAAHRTHGLDAIITRCSNNYGPYQFPEKFIPLFISHALDDGPLPLYGDGKNVRDWIHVEDHTRGVYLAYTRGQAGRVYNLGGECERDNRTVAELIVKGVPKTQSRVTLVKDRLAHDRRYAIDCTYARHELGFVPGPPIEERLAEVILWYQKNRPWWEAIKAGAYRDYYREAYASLFQLSAS